MEDNLLKCSIRSGFMHVQEFVAALEPRDITAATKMPYSENVFYLVGGGTLKHSTCSLSMAVLKGFELAAGLALKIVSL